MMIEALGSLIPVPTGIGQAAVMVRVFVGKHLLIACCVLPAGSLNLTSHSQSINVISTLLRGKLRQRAEKTFPEGCLESTFGALVASLLKSGCTGPFVPVPGDETHMVRPFLFSVWTSHFSEVLGG